MNSGSELRILVADDHAVVRQGLSGLLCSQPNMVVAGEARNGREAVELAARLRPDVILMDLSMPVMDGIEATTQIMKAMPDARVVVLTVYGGDEDVFRALQAGACAYMLKETEGEDILRTIRSVAAGKTCLPQPVAAKLAERVRGTELTARECEVLRLVSLGRTNRAIADALFVAESTVKTHVNSILSKLDSKDRTEAVAVALRRGILHSPGH